jgi:thioredoxin 1
MMATTLAHVTPEPDKTESLAPTDSWPICTIGGLRELLAQGGLTLVEFWAPDCLFSRLLAPARAQFPSSLGHRLRLLCCTLDGVETNATAFGADALPALVLFNGPQRVRRWLGSVDVSLLQHQIETALADSPR